MGEEKKYKISVITAVYNVEEYLEEMIESIIKQTIGFENIQLILVDDGSKDDSGNICDRYAEQYSDHIVAIHKANGGASSARNEGIKYAQGEYLNFTDADDLLENNALEVMYNYLRENKEVIDLVSIRQVLFGAISKEHGLNYRFKRTRIIDLREEYDCIQLAMNCTLIKRECFRDRSFDPGLSYAEDAQLVVDILLDKMQYGVVCESSYLYRKREGRDSMLDIGRYNPDYYIPYMEKFVLYSLKNAMARKGFVPEFVQYTCMYDLQWRLNQDPLVAKGVLKKEEAEQYKSLILDALQYIDNNIIVKQKFLANNYKTAILLLKEENAENRKIELYQDDIKIQIKNDFVSAGVSTYMCEYEFIDIDSEQITIEGYVRYFVELDDIQIILRQLSDGACVENEAVLLERNEHRSYCMDEAITEAKGFRFHISREGLTESTELQLCLRYQEHTIICKNISFGKFFPLSRQMQDSYFYGNGILLSYSGNMLKLLKAETQDIVEQYEKKFEEAMPEGDRALRQAYFARKAEKEREIWLISDRLTKADDNGEAFFTYMNTIGKVYNIDTYFLLNEDSKDYERLCKVGKVVSFGSEQHKMLSLLCDKLISSQADDDKFNPFFDSAYLYKDIVYWREFIYLRHGISKNNMTRWLRKENKNFAMLVATTYLEYQAMLEDDYHYDEGQIRLCGLTRYDYLYDDAEGKNIIIFMPIWRAYLVNGLDVHTDSRTLKKGFKESSFYEMYQKVFSDERLHEAAQKYHYTFKLMLHPAMPRECEKYFMHSGIEILGRNARYRELFAESKLLVTDYSSVAFDFAYLWKPVVYYQYDAEEFSSGKHIYDEGYFDYKRDGFGEVEYSPENLVDRLIEYMQNGCELKRSYRDRIEKTFPYHDKNNCRRVCEALIREDIRKGGYIEEAKDYKISIITAVYNVEEYLEEMIDSVLEQTIGFENVQLILVDDGSVDSSGEICDRYAMQYPDNIVVVHKENGGVSSARNEGLKRAKGEYLNFTDADDKLENNALEVMYEYLRENEEWIDLVAIRQMMFGAVNRGHGLNYRFNRTRIADLRKEYNCIQLALNCTLIKRECFSMRRFDLELSYAEDAQLVIDILLDKMKYGVVCEASYMYRKRDTGDSALDLGRGKAKYYVPYVERFILHSLENAKSKKGYVPQFVQYTCMYDLQWRLNRNPLIEPGVLTEEEERKYREYIVAAIQYIDNKIILEQKWIGNNYKMAIMSLKEENKFNREFVFSQNDLKVCMGDISSAGVGEYTMNYEFINITQDKVVIEGHVRYFAELQDVEIIIKEVNEGVALREYKAELCEREGNATIFMDEVITLAKGFRVGISRDEISDRMELQLCLRHQGKDIIWKNISFGKFFPLAKQLKNSYLYEEGILLTYIDNRLILSKLTDGKQIKKYEKNLLKEMLVKKDKKVFRGLIARSIYHILKPFKKKELWMVSDRLTKADDNGEAFFTYMNMAGKNPNISTYFVLEKDSEDYERLRKIGKVVQFHSTKHKILSLLCDKIVSSQAEGYVINRFFDMSYLYKDILHRQKFVFLQHGVTKDNQSRWMAKENMNISLLVTTTRMEYQSIFDCAYHYDENQVKCTGFSRYDYLYDHSEDKNVITFMPTWRAYLTGWHNLYTDSRLLKAGFEDSLYCKMYREVFSSDRLFEAAKKYHYDIKLMLHPTMPRECIEYFNCSEAVEILDRSTRYRDVYAESKLIVTDYSSAVFDFAYLRKPVLYYQQDVDDFFSGKHTYDKGYFDYERDGFGEVEYTAEALVDRMIEYMENDCKLKDVYRDRIDKTFPYNDKNNCKRVYEEIIKL